MTNIPDYSQRLLTYIHDSNPYSSAIRSYNDYEEAHYHETKYNTMKRFFTDSDISKNYELYKQYQNNIPPDLAYHSANRDYDQDNARYHNYIKRYKLEKEKYGSDYDRKCFENAYKNSKMFESTLLVNSNSISDSSINSKLTSIPILGTGYGY